MQPQPNRHIDFDPGLGLLNSVDKYDRSLQTYYSGELEENSSRALELSQIKAIPEEEMQTIPYRHLVTLSQSKENRDEIEKTLVRTGDIKKLNTDEIKNLKSRLNCIEEWLDNYAPESVKFKIQKNVPNINFNSDEKIYLENLKEKMTLIDWNPESIHDSFYELQEKSKVSAKEYFRIMYLVLLGKERGPRLGFFLATIDKDFIIKRLNSY